MESAVFLQRLMQVNYTHDGDSFLNQCFRQQPQQPPQQQQQQPTSTPRQSQYSLLQQEVAARQQVQFLNRILHPTNRNKAVSRKQRTKLQRRQELAQERLLSVVQEQGGSTFQSATLEELNGFSKPSGGTMETMYERQVLVERLRLQLQQRHVPTLPLTCWQQVLSWIDTSPHERLQGLDTPLRSWQGVLTVQRRSVITKAHKPLRLIVLSDTHGMEQQLLPPLQEQLPAADVLIHCGDFWGGGSVRKHHHLDSFLAAQTHIPIKLVVRGNHDPKTPGSVLFPKSKATYVTHPGTLELPHGVLVALRPYSRHPHQHALPPHCDILVSHEPPHNVLDTTYHGQSAGSISLRRLVTQAPPALWLCGHIHEGRGAVRHAFAATNQTTLVVNAANANDGKARCLVQGPVLIDVVSSSDNDDDTVWQETREGSSKLLRPDSLEALVVTNQTSSSESGCLLAVDLGLRTGTAVFDRNGTILAVDTWHFRDHDALRKGLQNLFETHNISHVVIEGEDGKLFGTWRQAVERLDQSVHLARVIADDWRRVLLTNKERRDARKAKSAAGLIAKQLLVLQNSSSVPVTKKLSADAAEALLVGHYSVRLLGWVDSSEPPVRRYQNGNVAV
jgi:Icc-related predicted phosphoesterase